MAPKPCGFCNTTKYLETDYSAGRIVCQQCGNIVEENLLVSEVGFSEGAGGKVHVQGTFVSHHQTGISGFRGGAGSQSSERIKSEGAAEIKKLGLRMGVPFHTYNSAARLFSLAIDNRFNRGRKKEYVIASCLYLQCRLAADAHMLIDFSERLAINVYELGSTYLRLRSTLHMDIDILPMVDPAIYNLRFANQLDFGREDAKVVAEDASRLVRRFKADWMTQGRRPAGICGACLIIAGRMSNYLRTPEEVAQVVKVSPATIKRRLVEFARTKGADLTVQEWRSLSRADLETPDDAELPPVMKKRREIEIKEEAKREKSASLKRDQAEADADDGTVVTTRGKRKGKGKQMEIEGVGLNGVMEAAAEGMDVAEEEDEDEEGDLAPLFAEDYIADLTSLDPAEIKAQKARERKALFSSIKTAGATEDMDVDDLLELAAEAVEAADGEGSVDNEKTDEKTDEAPLEENDPKESRVAKVELPKFDKWDDQEAVYRHLEERYLSDNTILWKGDSLRPKVLMWLKDRDPREVIQEIEAVDRARILREKGSRAKAEHVFEDLDDEELDAYWVMGEDERQARARMWLSHNGGWLEQDKERQEKKAAYNKAHGIDPTKPKPKRKRINKPHKGPHKSTEAAMESFQKVKKLPFSTRINQAVARSMGLFDDDRSDAGSISGLTRMVDPDEDGKDDNGEEDDYDSEYDDEKYDD